MSKLGLLVLPLLLQRVDDEVLYDMDSFENTFYGNDQAYESYPVRFPTVNIPLESTALLYAVANMVRVVTDDKFTNEIIGGDSGLEGHFNFYIGLNGYTKSKVDNCITFTVQSDFASDDGEEYTIDLDEQEQELAFSILSDILEKATGHDADWHLEQARKAMEEKE